MVFIKSGLKVESKCFSSFLKALALSYRKVWEFFPFLAVLLSFVFKSMTDLLQFQKALLKSYRFVNRLLDYFFLN